MMIRLIVLLFLITGGLTAQAPPLPKLPQKLHTSERKYVDPAAERPVMVLDIIHNQRHFALDRKTVTDTLKGNLEWKSITDVDSIMKYSDSPFVKEVLIIERKP